MSNNNKFQPFIFTKKANINYKLIPFNISTNNVGKTKYLPPVSKEWKNSVYSYNNQNIINYPIFNLNVNSLIKGYFGLYFNNIFLNQKLILPKNKRESYNKIFISKAEIKHTNNKAIITIYVFNRERLALLNKIKKYNNSILKLSAFLEEFLSKNNIKSNGLTSISIQDIFVKLINYIPENKDVLSRLYYRNTSFAKAIKDFFIVVRRLRLKLSLNKFKFEQKFLNKLSQLISRYYGKKVEFNIVNLKSLAYNTDIFTEVLTLKLKKNITPMKRINSLLAKAIIPKRNLVLEKGRIEKGVNHNLIQNLYKNNNISSIINNSNQDSLNKLLYNVYSNEVNLEDSNFSKEKYYSELRKIIFNNIKYKTLGGAKLMVKGRLTRRYRADRAVYKFKLKGGLKNIDAAFKGLSTVVHRGYLDSNVEKATLSSKRRIGSFGVRTWLSGK